MNSFVFILDTIFKNIISFFCSIQHSTTEYLQSAGLKSIT